MQQAGEPLRTENRGLGSGSQSADLSAQSGQPDPQLREDHASAAPGPDPLSIAMPPPLAAVSFAPFELDARHTGAPLAEFTLPPSNGASVSAPTALAIAPVTGAAEALSAPTLQTVLVPGEDLPPVILMQGVAAHAAAAATEMPPHANDMPFEPGPQSVHEMQIAVVDGWLANLSHTPLVAPLPSGSEIAQLSDVLPQMPDLPVLALPDLPSLAAIDLPSLLLPQIAAPDLPAVQDIPSLIGAPAFAASLVDALGVDELLSRVTFDDFAGSGAAPPLVDLTAGVGDLLGIPLPDVLEPGALLGTDASDDHHHLFDDHLPGIS